MKLLIAITMVIVMLAIPALGCGVNEAKEAVPFSIQVNPVLVVGAYVGQAYIFSVTALCNEGGKAVNISASVSSGDVSVNPKTIEIGQNSKVTVIPSVASVGKTLTITIEGERDGLIETATANIEMGDTGDSEGETN
ncbi:hypothetical protein ACFLYB_05135 [Chloroflexota bacterium]